MEFERFLILVKGMKSVYTSERFLPDADSVKMWYSLLKDISYEALNIAIQKYMLINKFPPTIADLRELALSAQLGELPDWGEAWEQLTQAIRRYGSYRAGEALDSLSPLCRKTVERLGYLQLCASENIAADRANFRMIYEQLQQREKQQAQLPEGLKILIAQMQQGTLIEG